jgi:hypothetical protein
MNIKLGNRIRCKVTGLEGIATSRVEYINGCVQYALTPKSEGNKYPEACYLDEKQIEDLGTGVEIDSKRTGGPQINSPKI